MQAPEAQLPGRPKGPGLFTKLSAKCASHPGACLGIIIVLAVLLVVTYVRHHGLLGIGPYSEASRRVKMQASKKPPPAKPKQIEEKEPGGAADEAERLIDSINKS